MPIICPVAMATHEHDNALRDDVLLGYACDGCADCFAALFHRYFRQVFTVAFKILRDRNEAEDVLQEVFLAIFLQKERFDASKGSVRTWILQFAYFKSLLRRRYLRIRNFYNQEEIAEEQEARATEEPSSAIGLSRGEWTHLVEKGVAALSSKQRRVMELVHVEGCTLQEAADVERESLANTRNYYYRGLKALRTFLQAKVEDGKAKAGAVLNPDDAYGYKS